MGAQKKAGIRGKRKRKRAAALRKILEQIKLFNESPNSVTHYTMVSAINQMIQFLNKATHIQFDRTTAGSVLMHAHKPCDVKLVNDWLINKLTYYGLPYAVELQPMGLTYRCDIQMIGAMDRDDKEMIQILHI
jgi:hypothetical protein